MLIRNRAHRGIRVILAPGLPLVAIALAVGFFAPANAEETAHTTRKLRSWVTVFGVTLKKRKTLEGFTVGHMPRTFLVHPVSRGEVESAVETVLQHLHYGLRPPHPIPELPPLNRRPAGHEEYLWTDVQEIDQKFLSWFGLRDINAIVKHPGSASTVYGLQIAALWFVDGAEEDMQIDPLHGMKPKLGTRQRPETKVRMELAAILYQRGTKSGWSEFPAEYDCEPILGSVEREIKGALRGAPGSD